MTLPSNVGCHATDAHDRTILEVSFCGEVVDEIAFQIASWADFGLARARP